MNIKQLYNDEELGIITYSDKNESIFSVFCQPRDIALHDRSIVGENKKRLKTDIAIDIRLAQGMDDEKARAKLKYRN